MYQKFVEESKKSSIYQNNPAPSRQKILEVFKVSQEILIGDKKLKRMPEDDPESEKSDIAQGGTDEIYTEVMPDLEEEPPKDAKEGQ